MPNTWCAPVVTISSRNGCVDELRPISRISSSTVSRPSASASSSAAAVAGRALRCAVATCTTTSGRSPASLSDSRAAPSSSMGAAGKVDTSVAPASCSARCSAASDSPGWPTSRYRAGAATGAGASRRHDGTKSQSSSARRGSSAGAVEVPAPVSVADPAADRLAVPASAGRASRCRTGGDEWRARWKR